jgi:hypothetical protein
MRIQPIIIFLLYVSALGVVTAQQDNPKRRFVVLPPEQGMLVVASQPNSPLEFIDPKLLVDVKGPSGLWVKSFGMRNRGTKPIRSYTVAAADQGEWRWEAPDVSHYIMPGQTAPPLIEDGKNEIVPLTDQLRESLKLHGPMKGIVALIVVQVEYADGSAFQERAYGALNEYFERVYAAASVKESAAKE